MMAHTVGLITGSHHGENLLRRQFIPHGGCHRTSDHVLREVPRRSPIVGDDRHSDSSCGRNRGSSQLPPGPDESSGLIELEDDALVARLRERASGLTLSDPRRINTTQNGDEAFRFVDLFELRGFVE